MPSKLVNFGVNSLVDLAISASRDTLLGSNRVDTYTT